MRNLLYIAAAAAPLVLPTIASAHSPNEIADLLRDNGYTRIDFVESNPPNYMANACHDGVRYHFHVNYRGEVTERRQIGDCEGRDHHRRWDSPRR